MPYLHVSVQDNKIAVYELDEDEVAIGRTANNDIQLDNPGVSSAHALIRKEGEDYFLEDCGSKNGTYVKGRKISQYRLEYGDIINIYKYQLRFIPFLGNETSHQPGVGSMTSADLNQSGTVEIDMRQHEEILAQQSPSKVKATVTVYQENGTARSYTLDRPGYTIGKQDDCLIKTSGLMAPAVSANLIRQGSDYLLSAVRKGEVLVNGEPIEKVCRLDNGDVFEVRKLRIRYQTEIVIES